MLRELRVIVLALSVAAVSALPIAVAEEDVRVTPPSGKARILHKEKKVKGPIEEVWRCWTTSEGIASFFSPESNIKLEIGGPYELFMSKQQPDKQGKRGSEGCKVLSYIPNEMLAFEWNFPPAVESLRYAGAKTQVVLQFTPLKDGQILVTFDQLGWGEGEDWDKGYGYFDKAWTWVLDQLAARREKYAGKSETPPEQDVKVWKDGAVKVTSIAGPLKRQDFEMDVPAPVHKVWHLLATTEGFQEMGAKDGKIELTPGGAYSFWPGAPNKVLAFVPGQMLSTSGSAPEQFPNVRKGGTWSAYWLEPIGKSKTRLRLSIIGWRLGEKEWDDAFDYFLKANPQFLNFVHAKLSGKSDKAHAGKKSEEAKGADAGDVLRHEGVIAAPVADVWAAFTTREGIESWMVPRAEIDLRVGGKMLTTYDPKGVLGDDSTIENTILSYEPMRMLSIKATKPPANFPHQEAIKNMWSVVYLEPVGAGQTRVTVVGMGYGTDEASQKLRAHFDKGNAWTVQKLREKFEKKSSAQVSELPAAPVHSAEFESYLAHVAAAETSLVLNETAGVRRWLDKAPAAHRNWEWRHLDASLDHSVNTWADNAETVMSLAYSPDGKTIAEALLDGSAILRDAGSGKITREWKDLGKSLWHVAFSADGKHVVTSGADGVARVFDTAAGTERLALKHEKSQVYSAAFSPDGKRIVTSMLGFVKLWDAGTGAEIQTLKGHVDRPPVPRVVFSPDGTRLASASWDNNVIVWDAASGEVIHKLGPGYGGSEYTPYNAVVFSPDGKRVAAASGSGTCWIWDAASGDMIRKWTAHEKTIYGLSYSRDGKELATGSMDQSIRLWNAESGEQVASLRGHTDAVWSVMFSPDDNTLASGSADGCVKFWTQGDEKPAFAVKCEKGVWGTEFSPDGKLLATASSDKSVKVWDARTGQLIVDFPNLPEQVCAVAFSPDGAQLVATTNKPNVHVFDIRLEKQARELEGNKAGSPDVAWSRDGKWIVSSSYDKTIRVWDAESGQTVHTLSNDDHYSYAVAIDSRSRVLASADGDSKIRLWDIESGKEKAALAGMKSRPLGVAFSPDDKLIAASGYDTSIHVWDVESGQLMHKMPGHHREVYGLAFTPDGSRLASASSDETVRLWDVSKAVEVATLIRSGTGAYALAFSPDGSRLAASFTNGEVRVLDTVSFAKRVASQPPRAAGGVMTNRAIIAQNGVEP